MDACNVMVVVTRWYGGVHLGPDRFKHINNCARQLLEEYGYIKTKVRHDSFHLVVPITLNGTFHELSSVMAHFDRLS